MGVSMKNSMTIRGCSATIQYGADIDMFRGEFIDLEKGYADFYADSISKLHKEGSISLRIYLEEIERLSK